MATLMRDPSSWLHAAHAGWDHPMSRETAVLMDIHDLQHAFKVKRAHFKPYPRPWPDKKTKLGGKRTQRRTPAQVMALLRPKVDSSQPPS